MSIMKKGFAAVLILCLVLTGSVQAWAGNTGPAAGSGVSPDMTLAGPQGLIAGLAVNDEAIWGYTTDNWLVQVPQGEGKFSQVNIDATVEEPLKEDAIYQLLLDPDGDGVWLATTAGALQVAGGRLITRLSPREAGLETGTVTGMAVDGQGGFWLGTPVGLIHWDAKAGWGKLEKPFADNPYASLMVPGPNGTLVAGFGTGRLRPTEGFSTRDVGTPSGLALRDREGNWYTSSLPSYLGTPRGDGIYPTPIAAAFTDSREILVQLAPWGIATVKVTEQGLNVSGKQREGENQNLIPLGDRSRFVLGENDLPEEAIAGVQDDKGQIFWTDGWRVFSGQGDAVKVYYTSPAYPWDRAARDFLEQLRAEGKYGLAARLVTTVITLYPDGKMQVDGKDPAGYYQAAMLQQDGTTYIPLRAAVEALGGRVAYDPDTSTVALYYGNRKAFISLSGGQVKLSDADFDQVQLVWQGASLMVPVRWLVQKLLSEMNPAEVLAVHYQESTGEVYIYRHRWELMSHLPATTEGAELTLYLLVPWGMYPEINLAELPSPGAWSFSHHKQPPGFDPGKYTLAETNVRLVPGDNHLSVKLFQGPTLTSPLTVKVTPEDVPFPYRLDARGYPLGWEEDFTLVAPVSGYADANKEFQVKLSGIPKRIEKLVITYRSQQEEETLELPVQDGNLEYTLQPAFGSGVYDVTVSVPDAFSMPDHPERSAVSLVRFWVNFQ